MGYLPRQLENSRSVDRTWFVAACICAYTLTVSVANGQSRPRYPLSPAQIVDEMQNRQLPTRGVQVRLAAPITAATENPVLEIQTIALLNPHELRLRMICRDRTSCLPFFATADFSEALSPASVTAKPIEPTLAKILTVSAVRPVTDPPATPGHIKQAGLVDPPILRSGSRATLELDQERVHVRIEVVCLEGGAAGDKIRVTALDSKQVYVARIVSPKLLKGAL